MDYPEPLPEAEQARLREVMRTGNPSDARAARDTLIATSLRLVASVARSNSRGAAAYDDVFQAGVEGLIAAVDTHEKAAGPWPPYAAIKIRQAIGEELRAAGFAVRVPQRQGRRYHQMAVAVSKRVPDVGVRAAVREVAEAFGVPASTVADALEARASAALEADDAIADTESTETAAVSALALGELQQVVASLPGLEADVIRERLGLRTGTPAYMRDVADRLGVPRGRVAELEARAYSRLRHPTRASLLSP